MSSQVLELRQAIAERFPGAVPLRYHTAPAVSTGIAALDRILPGGGFPRGQLVLWAPGGGATAVLRGASVAVCESGERSAWVDGAGRVLGESWPAGPLLVRPGGERAALACAEELLRSGGFGLVVLGGAERAAGREAVRLTRAAREGGGAFVMVGEASDTAHLRVRSRMPPDGYRWRRGPFGERSEVEAVTIEVEASALGWSGRTRFVLPVLGHRGRVALDPLLVDRRGVRKRSRQRQMRSSHRAQAPPAGPCPVPVARPPLMG
jgi:hypothetical protein